MELCCVPRKRMDASNAPSAYVCRLTLLRDALHAASRRLKSYSNWKRDPAATQLQRRKPTARTRARTHACSSPEGRDACGLSFMGLAVKESKGRKKRWPAACPYLVLRLETHGTFDCYCLLQVNRTWPACGRQGGGTGRNTLLLSPVVPAMAIAVRLPRTRLTRFRLGTPLLSLL